MAVDDEAKEEHSLLMEADSRKSSLILSLNHFQAVEQ